MLQISGQLDSAEANSDVQQPDADAVPASGQEKPEELTPEDQPKEAEPAQEQKKAPPKKTASKKPPSKKAPPKKAPPKSTGRLFLGLLVKICFAVGFVWALFTFVFSLNVHYGNNMYPAVHDGDLVVSFRMQKPYIKSVVLYRIKGKTEVGRVIAMEGSVVDIATNGLLTVNGAAPSDEIFYPTYQADNSPIKFPYTVEPGKVFILNDFRDDTNDSRMFGAVDKKDLEGPLLFTARRRNF